MAMGSLAARGLALLASIALASCGGETGKVAAGAGGTPAAIGASAGSSHSGAAPSAGSAALSAAGAGAAAAGMAGNGLGGTAGAGGTSDARAGAPGAGAPSLGGAGAQSGGGTSGVAGQLGNAGSSATTGTGGADIRFEIAKASCAAMRSCCKTNPPPTWTADPVLCEQRLPWPLLELEQQSIYIPDYARLAACLAAYQAAAVDCDFEPYIACRNLFKGTILPGQMCAHGDACQEGSYCAFAAAPTSADTCAAITRRKLGEECNWSCTDRYCPNETQAPAPAIVACYESDGLYCDQTMVPNVCRRILSVGSPCKTGTDCGTYAVCDKTCKAKGSLGKDCAAGCPDYQTCDPDTYKCKYSPFDSPTMCTVPLP